MERGLVRHGSPGPAADTLQAATSAGVVAQPWAQAAGQEGCGSPGPWSCCHPNCKRCLNELNSMKSSVSLPSQPHFQVFMIDTTLNVCF